MKILYVTCAENGLYGLKHLIRSKMEVSAVVTISPETAQKANVSGYVDVSQYAVQAGLHLVVLKGYELKASDIAGIDADILIVNGWNRLIHREVIESIPSGGIGVHAGHPPIGLGRAPLVWNILLGHTDLEVYIFQLTSGADDGDIVARTPVEITPWDTVKTLYEKVMFQAARLLVVAVNDLAAGNPGQPQLLECAVSYEKRTPCDGAIDFSQNEYAVHNFVRAQTPPYPGAFAFLDGVRWQIFEAAPFDRFSFRDVQRVPGQILAALPSGLIVMTGGAPVWITSARREDGVQFPDDLSKMERLVGRRFLMVGDKAPRTS